MTRPFNRVIDAVASIATKLGVTVSSKGDRLADNLEAVASSDIWIGGGGGGALVVILTEDAENPGSYAANHTTAEMVAAFDAGQPVIAYVDVASGKPTPFVVDFGFDSEDHETILVGGMAFYGSIGASGPLLNIQLWRVVDEVWSAQYHFTCEATLVTQNQGW